MRESRKIEISKKLENSWILSLKPWITIPSLYKPNLLQFWLCRSSLAKSYLLLHFFWENLYPIRNYLHYASWKYYHSLYRIRTLFWIWSLALLTFWRTNLLFVLLTHWVFLFCCWADRIFSKVWFILFLIFFFLLLAFWWLFRIFFFLNLFRNLPKIVSNKSITVKRYWLKSTITLNNLFYNCLAWTFLTGFVSELIVEINDIQENV